MAYSAGTVVAIVGVLVAAPATLATIWLCWESRGRRDQQGSGLLFGRRLEANTISYCAVW